MICPLCEERPATVHITEIEDGVPRTLHCCAACAAERGLMPQGPALSLKDLLHSAVQAAQEAHSLLGDDDGAELEAAELEALDDAPLRTCPACEISFEKFRRSGRFGCPNDYDVFAPDVEALLTKIHGAARHAGKTPGRQGERAARQAQLRRLQQKLEDAIAREAYEDAAEHRDEIRALEVRIAQAPTEIIPGPSMRSQTGHLPRQESRRPAAPPGLPGEVGEL